MGLRRTGCWARAGIGALVLAACSQSHSARERTAVPEGGAGPQPAPAGGTSGVRSVQDAGARRPPPATPAQDADVSRMDARSKDRGPATSCDPARCPVAELPLYEMGPPGLGMRRQVACCIELRELRGGCGMQRRSWISGDWDCIEVVEGVPDPICLDTIANGEVVEGCRRPDGQCGHDTPGWGCHELYRDRWDRFIDDATTPLPNPFVCTPYGQPCTSTSECCWGNSNGPACWLDLRSVEADADVPVGICDGSEEHDPGASDDDYVELPRYERR